MANEAVLKVENSLPENFTCADGTGIEKGTILKLTDARTAIASSATGDMLAGISSGEKIASNGTTYVGVYPLGCNNVFDCLASGAIAIGLPVMSSGHGNYVQVATGTASGAMILGYSEETASDDETIMVRMR